MTSIFRSRRAGGGFPLLLLAFQLMNALSGGNGAYPTTFGIIIGNLLAYLQPNIAGRSFRWHWPEVDQVCISAGGVWYNNCKQWSRLLLSPFFHLDDWHIYYNMASFLWKGISLSRGTMAVPTSSTWWPSSVSSPAPSIRSLT